MGWVTLRLNYRLKDYVSRQYLWTVRWGNGYSITLSLKVITQSNFVADFIRLKLNFIQKTKYRILRHPLAFFEGVAHFERKFQRERASPRTTAGAVRQLK